MVRVVREKVLTLGGVQDQFVGVGLGVEGREFLLRPDSETGVRPNDLRVMRLSDTMTLVIRGGTRDVELASGEISQKVFNRLSEEQKKTLARLAEDLSGRIWPDAGKVLQQRIQQIGEEEILRALRKLFKVAEGTMRKFALPRVGKLFKT